VPFLKDEKFSEGIYIPLAKPQRSFKDRIEYISDFCRGKKIIHVGCLDHEPLILKKIEADIWLHKRIDEVAEKQVGIDINLSALAFVKEKTMYQNVFYEDIRSDQPPGNFIQESKWDAMILGEVLEHVNDPIEFLKKLKAKYSAFAKEVLISVPNAFALENFKLALRHKECINSDHRSWFSIYTLAKNLAIAGYSQFAYEFVRYDPDDYKGKFLHNLFLKQYPSFRSTIVMHAQFSQHELES